MAVTINASTSTGLVQSADNSGIIQFQSNGVTKATLNSSGFSYPGAVLQVVSTQSQSAEIATSSSSYVTTGISASITPTSSTSKILILLSCTLDNQASGRQMVVTFYRGGTDLASTRGTTQLYSDGGRVQASGSCMYLDSPATASSTTYTVYFRSTTGGNTVKFANDNTMTSFTLMEIAA
jgi:hypothetical protein